MHVETPIGGLQQEPRQANAAAVLNSAKAPDRAKTEDTPGKIPNKKTGKSLPQRQTLTSPAMSVMVMFGGTSLAGLYFLTSHLNLWSGTGTMATLGSMVQKGKFSAGTCIFPRMLKKDDFPTLGTPTMPTLTLLPGRPSITFLGASSPWEGSAWNGAEAGGITQLRTYCVCLQWLQMQISNRHDTVRDVALCYSAIAHRFTALLRLEQPHRLCGKPLFIRNLQPAREVLALVFDCQIRQSGCLLCVQDNSIL